MRFFRFFIAITVLAILFYAPDGYAQNTYTPPTEIPDIDLPRAVSPQDELDELLDGGKIIRTPQTLKEYTYLHYKQCLETEHPVLTSKDLKKMCSCTSQNFSKSMSVENIKEIEKGSAEGVFQQNRLLYFVYAPCVEPVLKNVLLLQCMQDKKAAMLMKNHPTYCICFSDEISRVFGEYAPKAIKSYIVQPDGRFDPLNLLINDYYFENELKHKTYVCHFRHEKHGPN
ncbi:MAG: hypothetical protein AB8B83_02220 [Bdellovibrionales bacterium]